MTKECACEVNRDSHTYHDTIVYCSLHAKASEMRDALQAAQEALDVLAEDAEEAGYSVRADAATEQAMKIRALLREIEEG